MAIFKIQLEDGTDFEVPLENPTVYLLLDGTRAMTGDLDMGGNAIVSVGNVDGRDVSADGAVLDAHVADVTDPHGSTMFVTVKVQTPQIRNVGAAGVTLDAFNATAHSTVYVLNSDGAFSADLDVARNIIVGGTVDGRDVAADGAVLDTAVLETDVDAKGDLFVATADDTVARLAVGSNTKVLTAASGEATGTKWDAIGESHVVLLAAATAHSF